MESSFCTWTRFLTPMPRDVMLLIAVMTSSGCWGDAYLDGGQPMTNSGASPSADAEASTTSVEGTGEETRASAGMSSGDGGGTSGDEGTTSGSEQVTSDGADDTGQEAPPLAAPNGSCGEFSKEPGSKASWIFVTEETFRGNLVPPDGWTKDDGWGDDGRVRGDRICQCSASRANLKGEFVAWLSINDQSINDYLKGRGSLSEHRHFVRRDGNVSLITGLCCGRQRTPARLTGRRSCRGSKLRRGAWTGTFDGGGETNSHCDSWSRDQWSFGWVGGANLRGIGWSSFLNISCDSNVRLYCLQVGDDAPGDVEQYCRVEKE
jgi:hypothetical protein